jgi:uncharacterized damage-inducible protein DinB
MPVTMPSYEYQGARVLVLLHEEYLAECVRVWREARAAGLALPQTTDPDYQSLETLMRHVLRAARGYMTWMCGVLELPDPGIETAPEVDVIAEGASEYVRHLSEKWRTPLAAVPEERFNTPEYPSRWGVLYCVDAMLEHAVMHPIRHAYQLRRLLEAAGPTS